VDSTESMAKLAMLYAMLFIYASGIVYLWRLQKSLKFAILVGKKSKICDFLVHFVESQHNFPNLESVFFLDFA